MTEATTNLGLPAIAAAQAQKHVTHNEALRALDALVQLAVLDRDLISPPTEPDDGERWLVASGAGEEWEGHDHEIAAWQNGGWLFYPPRKGWLCYVADENIVLIYDGDEWRAINEFIPALHHLAMLGIGAEADAANPFSAKLNKALWSALYESEDGDGALRYTLNKEGPEHVLSLLMQSNWSGRAEIGLVGNDDLSFKVSADGNDWKEALVVDRVNGAVGFPHGLAHPQSGLAAPLYIPSPVAEIWRFDVSRPGTPRTATITGVSDDMIVLSSLVAGPNGQWGRWAGYMLNNAAFRIWNMTRSPIESAWIKNSPTTSTLQVTDPNHIVGWQSGDTIRLGDPNPTGTNVLQMAALDISGYLQNNFGHVFPQKGVFLGLWVQSSDGPASLDFSGTAAFGSAQGGNALSNGERNQTSLPVPTSILSPISNSNLVFVREQLRGGATDLTIGFGRILGVYV